jgi:hypothetical protein
VNDDYSDFAQTNLRHLPYHAAVGDRKTQNLKRCQKRCSKGQSASGGIAVSKCLRFNPEHARGTWLDAGLKRDPETRQGRPGPKVIFGALGEI